ncbi:MAG: DNA repair protein RecN [Proteobacteria bacterium]|nr:DNA repair protein RecN [Pseudomonadota bacterium]
MLFELYIKDLILIDTLSLTFHKGFSVLTGETGAGKSILLDALSLSLGKRGDVSFIRKGASQAIVSSSFLIDKEHTVFKDLESLELLNLESPLSLNLRRHISEKGSKSYINDIPVNLSTLKQIGDSLLEIHGQFDHLFDPKSHMKHLDAYIKDTLFKDLLKNIKIDFSSFKDYEERYKSLVEAEKNYEANIYLNKNIVDDLSPLDLIANEEDELLIERKSIEDLAKTSNLLDRCQNVVDSSLLKDLFSTITHFERLNLPTLSPLLDPLKRIESDLLEVKAQVDDLCQNTKESYFRLQQIDERLYVLRSRAKKYNITTHDLLPLLKNAELFVQKDFNASKQETLKKLEHAKKEAFLKAHEISKIRSRFALKLEEEINQELLALKLPNATFKVSIQQDLETITQKGIDKVEFLISANKNQDFTNLSKSASGGELARIMLALKSVLSQKTDLFTIVFDEIETGVSGSVAAAIGERMKKLSNNLQVLAITHSPQIAAKSDDHYFVTKQDTQTQTKTTVVKLSLDEKTTEIARMLSGENITESAMLAALDLLKA